MPAVIVAVWPAVDTTCGIAKAELSAAFIVGAAGAELRAIESGKQTAPAGLARDGGQGVLCRHRSGRGVL